MKTLTMLFTAVALCLLMQAASADQVYRWVDKDGRVHYSQTPPATTGVNAQTVNVTPAAPDPTSLQNEQRVAQQNQDRDKQNQDAQQKDQAAQQQRELQKKECDYLQQRLVILQQSGRVATVDAQGNKNYVSDDDRAKQEQQLQDQISKECGGH